jgi:4-hydroxybenzoate polyprenyltransferase
MASLKHYLSLVRFSHTLFALPFALASMLWAADGLPGWRVFGLILVCMVTCRNTAMAFNRLVDAGFDKDNPRTARRHIPAGILSRAQVSAFLIANAVVFVVAAFFVNRLAFALSLPTLLAVCGYSLTKRFTSLSHFALGLAIGISPVGAWIAVRGQAMAYDLARFRWPEGSLVPFLLCVSLLLWIGGFDIIYATQDHEFDKARGLHSLVVRLGVKGALAVSKAAHLAMWFCLAALGWLGGLGPAYAVCLALIAALLLYVHLFRRSASLDSLNQDFFLANIAVSVLVLIGIGIRFLA